MIPQDSPLLYRLFFNFHNNLDNFLTLRKTAAPPSAPAIDAGAAKLLGITVGDVQKLAGISHSVAAQLARIDRDEADYINSKVKREERPAPSALAQYRNQRDGASLDGITRLRAALSPGSYTGLLGFINGSFRASYRPVAKP